MTDRRLVFLGSGDFAVPCLRTLCALSLHPMVITKPDKPAGRGKRQQATPVKTASRQLGLEILELETLQNSLSLRKIHDKKPELLISAAYGNYIPPDLLIYPSLNVHPSLLPKYRGAAPIERVLMAGETLTGVTIAYIAEEWDSGDIVLQQSYPIAPEENAGMLREKLAALGATLLGEAIAKFFAGQLTAIPQDSSKKSFAPKIKEEETWIHWTRPALQIHNQIRGLSPAPGARSLFRGTRIKILQSRMVSGGGKPGDILRLEPEGPVVSAREEALLFLQVQPENRKIFSGKDFLNGYHPEPGETLQI